MTTTFAQRAIDGDVDFVLFTAKYFCRFASNLFCANHDFFAVAGANHCRVVFVAQACSGTANIFAKNFAQNFSPAAAADASSYTSALKPP